ncbi:MAG: hypothetical protein OEW27_04840 [Aquincola sp.]|nr:hypothetical protein [Aquincola sp.]
MRRPLHACLLWLLLASGPAAAAERDFVVVIHQQAAGQMKVTSADDGHVSTDLSYRDNGRGPDIRERFVIGALGAPVEYQGEGRATFGAEIREAFKVEAGRLRWTSRVDRGDEAVEPGTLFLPIEGTFAYSGEVVRSLLRRPGGRAPVVGGHQLSVEQVAYASVDGPDGVVALVLVALTGPTPRPGTCGTPTMTSTACSPSPGPASR